MRGRSQGRARQRQRRWRRRQRRQHGKGGEKEGRSRCRNVAQVSSVLAASALRSWSWRGMLENRGCLESRCRWRSASQARHGMILGTGTQQAPGNSTYKIERAGGRYGEADTPLARAAGRYARLSRVLQLIIMHANVVARELGFASVASDGEAAAWTTRFPPAAQLPKPDSSARLGRAWHWRLRPGFDDPVERGSDGRFHPVSNGTGGGANPEPDGAGPTTAVANKRTSPTC